MENIIIFGKNGQVASDLLNIFAQKQDKFTIYNYSSKDIDFSEINILADKLNKLPKADFIINATAYNYVDKAEDEPDMADKINHQAVGILAKYCQKNNIKFIHYSTNYVFDGSSNETYFENNLKNLKPTGIYGLSKLNGEKEIIKSNCNYLIFRVSTVFSQNDNNFVAKIMKLAQNNTELKIVDDQITNPTSSFDIAAITIKIIEEINKNNGFKNDIYHLTSANKASYFEFAKEIIKYMIDSTVKSIKIIPVKSSEFKTKAQRPLNGVLNCDKIEKEFNIKLPKWQDSLKNIITKINHNVKS
ncbi:dTDP-4-dehydrorhamnose reductase [Rickettsiales bacterium]|nr:dTDP-4-dehydrorhamnose reductase [Rickettsiales bacterium]